MYYYINRSYNYKVGYKGNIKEVIGNIKKVIRILRR